MEYKTDGKIVKIENTNITLINDDCMNILKQTPDNYYDLCVVDPPYGIGMDGGNVGYKGDNELVKKNWDKEIPKKEYFEELKRVSKHQIIWGGNYFGLPATRCFLVWDKGEGFYNRTYAECELAWTSFDKNTRKYKHDPLAKGDYKGKIHPTQKPVKLYDWIYANYAKPGQKILDTHLGSGSNAISAHYAKMEFVGCELDKDYFDASVDRIYKETRQMELF